MRVSFSMLGIASDRHDANNADGDTLDHSSIWQQEHQTANALEMSPRRNAL